jgi:hypothetical protein
MMQKPEAILVTDLFSPTLDALIELLVSLRSEDWVQSTVCDGWTVKDVALLLLAQKI